MIRKRGKRGNESNFRCIPLDKFVVCAVLAREFYKNNGFLYVD